MKSKAKRNDLIRAFAIELAIYAVLVTGYFFVALHFLGTWLKDIFDHERVLYAVVALGLIVGQGVILEVLTTWLLRVLGRKPR